MVSQILSSPFDFHPEKAYLTEKPKRLPTLRSGYVENPTAGDWNLIYNCLSLKVDPKVKHIEGNVRFIFNSLKDSLHTIAIDLEDNMLIDSVKFSGKPCSYTRENKLVTIILPEIVNKDEKGEFTIWYNGDPINGGVQVFSQKIIKGEPAIYTLSEPYGAREWWPCKESLSDKIDSIDLFIETPSTYKTASNGILVFDTIDGQKRVCHWKHRHSISTYLVFISVGNYETYTDNILLKDGTNLDVMNYVYKGGLDFAKGFSKITENYMKYFCDNLIEYPFKDEKYGHSEFGWTGGMEHQTMTSLGRFNEFLITHELAHQWFGDYITCSSWNELWLNEGFATYYEIISYDYFHPGYLESWKMSMFANLGMDDGKTIYTNDIDDMDGLFDGYYRYYKPAFVLYMLQEQIGSEAFKKGINNYLHDKQAIDGFTSTAILKKNMEMASDTNLSEFFKDWIMEPGYPVYDINWEYSNQFINIDVYQKPSVDGGPFYEMKLPVTIKSGQSENTYWLPNDKQGQRFSIPCLTFPESVIFNKEKLILCQEGKFNKSINETIDPDLNIYFDDNSEKITISDITDYKSKYSIYDISGVLQMNGDLTNSSSEIYLTGLNPGIYLISVSSEKSKKNAVIRLK